MDRGAATLTARDVAQRDRIASVGQGLMARHGSHSITMTGFAAALGHCVPTIRRHFADMDALLAYLLRQHLQFLAATLGAVPFGPERPATLRAAYLAATRSVMGGLTEAHLLLVRDRGLLPEDEGQPVEDTVQGLGGVLAGELGLQILHLLDSPLFNADQIECMVYALNAPAGRAADMEPTPHREAPATSACLSTPNLSAPNLSAEAECRLIDGLFRHNAAGSRHQPVTDNAASDLKVDRGLKAGCRAPAPVLPDDTGSGRPALTEAARPRAHPRKPSRLVVTVPHRTARRSKSG